MAKDNLQPETLGGPKYPVDSTTHLTGIDLTNPDNVLSGTYRGVQQLGGPSLTADAGNKRILVNDGTNRVLMGNQATFGEGFYVTKTGIDVTTATTGDQFIFNSSQNIFKIVSSGTVATSGLTVSSTAGNWNSDSTSVVVTHNLGFAPMVIGAFLGSAGINHTILPYSASAYNGIGEIISNIAIISNSTTISFAFSISVYGNTTGTLPANNIKYYLLQETAN